MSGWVFSGLSETWRLVLVSGCLGVDLMIFGVYWEFAVLKWFGWFGCLRLGHGVWGWHKTKIWVKLSVFGKFSWLGWVFWILGGLLF